ncbi:HAD-IA family hydrolase [Basfia succiniciproducens]|uniref:Hydrolase of the HAD superfamily n=1 Tax=Basfia succiniciproducens TaxID=653940 RepID=A0A1G5DHQ9_9PAST|nr:HAD-IA family hydrolase [Basfia succiniciproducens]QIM67979.1 HAD family hydrolase [Basfia succiniciproducens]SCY14273.1 putative hydrolase of the HAD superfamily [Basfia succiniciproducens]
MKFYRTLEDFKVISFDLDDTLYDNSQVILDAERHSVDFLRKISQIPQLDGGYWRYWKNKTALDFPLLAEDVTQWRIKTIVELLRAHQKSAVEIERISHAAMEDFFEWRHKMQVPQQNFEVLNKLKRQYKLAALTNGNVTPSRAGFDQFELVLTGGVQGRAKPHQDLFRQTAGYFNVRPHEILHVGDNLVTDVQGAIQAGCQAVWINLTDKKIQHFSEATLVPTFEITDLNELLFFRNL